MAEALRRGYQVAIPFGHDWRYDLIVERAGHLERVQVKSVCSDGKVIHVPCRSMSAWVHHKYTETEIDWLAVYDVTTKLCYFLPSSLLKKGRTMINLRLTPTKNNQTSGTRNASDFLKW